MGIGGYILAGALQGVGSGIASQAAADAEMRRNVALENLRAQRSQENARFTADLSRQNADHTARLNDSLDERKQRRGAYYGGLKIEQQGEQQRLTDTNRGAIQAGNEAADDARDFGYAARLENLRSRNDISEASHKDALEAARADREIDDVQVLASGQLMGVTKTGKTKPLMGTKDGKPIYLRTARPKEAGEEDAGVSVSTARAGRGGGATASRSGIGRAATGQPATTEPAANFAPLSPERAAAIMQETAPADGQFSGAASKVYTMADLKHTAQQNGISIEEARRVLSARGYTLTR